MPTPVSTDSEFAERRPRAKRGEGDALREEILDATEELLLEKGDQRAVSIRAVADRVGKTSPSVYLHFDDKKSLILAVCERQFEDLAEASRLAQEGLDDPVDRIRACGQAYVRFALDYPEQYRNLFMGRESDQTVVPLDDSLEDLAAQTAFQSLHESVDEAYEAGRIVGPDPMLTSLGLWASVHGVASMMLAKPSFPWPGPDDFVDLMVDTALYGLVPRD